LKQGFQEGVGHFHIIVDEKEVGGRRGVSAGITPCPIAALPRVNDFLNPSTRPVCSGHRGSGIGRGMMEADENRFHPLFGQEREERRGKGKGSL